MRQKRIIISGVQDSWALQEKVFLFWKTISNHKTLSLALKAWDKLEMLELKPRKKK